MVLALLTWGGFVFQVNLATIGFAYLLLVMAMALYTGFWVASLIAVLAAGCLDYFFAQPVFHFTMSNPGDVVALIAFEITTIVISRISSRELRSSKEAAEQKIGMEQLYELSRNSLLMDMHQPPGAQIVQLIHRIFRVEAVAVFDLHAGRQDRAGEWSEGEEDVAKVCYLRGTSKTIHHRRPGSASL